jgi:hypothetical protein
MHHLGFLKEGDPRVGLFRQRLERRAIDLFEQLAAGDAEPAKALLVIELLHELAKRGVDVDETGEGPSLQPAEQPALDDQDGLLDFRLVARLSRPRRQNGGSVMRRHLGVGPINLGVVEAGLDDGGPGVVRHDEFWNAADRLEGAHVGVDPVGSACVQLALAKVKLDAPNTATKIYAMRISQVSRSMTTGTPSPA